MIGTFLVVMKGLYLTYQAGKKIHSWAFDVPLCRDFEGYLANLERRKVLFYGWDQEDWAGVLPSLSEILSLTRDLQSRHPTHKVLKPLMSELIKTLQKEMDTIRASNFQVVEGQRMAYRALLRVRTKMAYVLSILCGWLEIEPRSVELRDFVLNFAVVQVKPL